MTERASLKNGTKRCTRCKRVLPVKSFRGEMRQCRDCVTARSRPSKKRAASRRYRISKTYGLTEDEFNVLLAAQGGRCAICWGERPYNLAVDHDHGTGEIRGLLCKTCNNRLLTSARDNIATLQRAVDYLTRPPARLVFGEPRIIPTEHLDEKQRRKVLRPGALAPSGDYEEQTLW